MFSHRSLGSKNLYRVGGRFGFSWGLSGSDYYLTQLAWPFLCARWFLSSLASSKDANSTGLHVCLWACALNHVQLSATPRIITWQAPLSMEFSRQEILEWVAILFSRESSLDPRMETSSQPKLWRRYKMTKKKKNSKNRVLGTKARYYTCTLPTASIRSWVS